MAIPRRGARLPLNIRLKKLLELVNNGKLKIILATISGIILAAVISFFIPKIYVASSKLSIAENSVYSNYLNNSGSFKNEIELLNSSNFLQKVKNKLSRENITISDQKLIEAVKIDVSDRSSSVDISVQNNDPGEASHIANAYSTAFSEISNLNSKLNYIGYMQLLVERQKAIQDEIKNQLPSFSTVQSSEFNIDQNRIILRISELESELENIELDNQYRVSLQKYLSKLIEDFSNGSAQNLVANNQTEFVELRTRIERIKTLNYLRKNITAFDQVNFSIPWSANLNFDNLNNFENRFQELLNNFIVNNSQEELSQREYFKDLLKQYNLNEIEINSIDNIKTIIFSRLTTLENNFNRIPFELVNQARVLRTKNFLNTLVVKINSKIESLKVEENNYFAAVSDIIKAEIPDSYEFPNNFLNILIGGILGLLIGISYILSSSKKNIEYINSVKDFESFDHTIIAEIPSFPDENQVLFLDLQKEEKAKLDPKIFEAFQSIETFLRYGSLDKPLKSILITSGQDSEGKSVIASNIAIALANSGNKVLLVDADLKHPSLNKYFNIKSSPSLAHFLFRKKELNEIVRNSFKENLKLITCIEFPQNPSVIITSERMTNFMERVKNEFDYIVYDSSSLCSLKETATLANAIDELIVVVRAGQTKLIDFFQTEDLLMQYGIREFNIIINDVKS